MPATVWMHAIAATQATTVTPATSNIKDDSNIMTAHNSRNASNSRNESNNRTANTVWTPSKVGMLAKTVKPATAWREAKKLFCFRSDNKQTKSKRFAFVPIISGPNQNVLFRSISFWII